jgi:hypothetical protein
MDREWLKILRLAGARRILSRRRASAKSFINQTFSVTSQIRAARNAEFREVSYCGKCALLLRPFES